MLDKILSFIADWITNSAVTGVKGNSESSYRKGNVNLTAGNVGALGTGGGTVTGNIALKYTNIDASKTNNDITETQYPTTFQMQDAAGRTLARLEAVINPNGKVGWNLYARNYDTSGTQKAQKGLSMHMDKTGAITYGISDNTKFHDALNESDWVVENGTNWRQWNSGIQECWGQITGTITVSAVMGGYGGVSGTLTFPKAFTNTPFCIANLTNFGSGYYWGAAREITKTGFKMHAVKNNSGNATFYASYHAIGRWK